MKGLWIHGAMPVELILIEVIAFILFLAVNYFLKKFYGRGIPKFFQGVLLIFAAYLIFKYIIFPPIPAALLITYMGLIALVVLLLLSTTDDSWNEVKDPIIKTLGGRTSGFKTARMITFSILPVLVGLGTYHYMKPNFQEPTELRIAHPLPPAQIEVHGATFDLQKARSPFRVDEKGNYSEGVQYKYRDANLYGK